VQAIRQLQVEIRVGDAADDAVSLDLLLEGMDVVISAISPLALMQQLNLLHAAKTAGVKRFVPSAFSCICPPGGAMALRDSVSTKS
jgi:hypothetical protein